MKIKIKSLFIIVFSIFLFFMGNIYAYNLSIDGTTSENGKIIFHTYVKASGHSITYHDNRTSNRDEYIEVDINDYGNRYGNYDIVGIVFSDSPTSNYNPTSKEPWIRKEETYEIGIDEYKFLYPTWIDSSIRNVAYYDTFSGLINESNYSNFLISGGNSKAEITNNSVAKSTIYGVGEAYFKYPTYRVIGSLGNEIVDFRYELDPRIFELSDVKRFIKKDEATGRDKIYFSFVTQSSGTGAMDTAASFLSKMYAESSIVEKYISWLKQSLKIEKLQEDSKGAKNSEQATGFQQEINAETQTLNRYVSENLNGLNLEDNSVIERFLPGVKGVRVTNLYIPGVTRLDWNFEYDRGWSGINDYDNILYLPDDMGGKNVYVQYAKENADGERFSLIENAPPKKEYTTDSAMREQYKNLIHGYTENGPENVKYYSDIEKWERNNSWTDLHVGANIENVKSDVIETYEKYNFSNLSKKTFANFIRMSNEEISGKANEALSYVKEYVYLGNENESYESLWNRIQNKQLEPKEDSGNGYVYESINDTRTIIIVFVYSPGSEKTVFVNYAEEDEEGNLNLLEVAPKNELDEELATVLGSVKFIHGYSTTGNGDLNKYDDILSDRFKDVIEYNRDRTQYEEYKFKQLSKQNYAYFVKMGLDELRGKTNNDKYKFSHTLVSTGTKDATYEELWKDGKSRNQMQLVDDPDGLGTCVFPIDNSNTVLVTFVYKKKTNKFVYVNYVKEESDGVLSELLVAPKEEEPLHNFYNMVAGIVTANCPLKENLNNISPEEDKNKYEKYNLTLYKKTPGGQYTFFYMSDDELNSKLKKLGYEDEKYRFRYFSGIKYVVGDTGEDYYELLEKNISNGNYKSNSSIIVKPDYTCPRLISFIYETVSNPDITLAVRHEVTNGIRLPIADWAHEILNADAVLFDRDNGKELNDDNTEATYEIYSKNKDEKIKLKELTMTPKFGDDTGSQIWFTYNNPTYNGKEYTFAKKCKIIGYRGDDERIEIGTYTCKDRIITTDSIGELIKQYTRIEVVFLYQDKPDNGGGGDEFIPCLYLSFKSEIEAGIKNCEYNSKGSVLLNSERCVEPYEAADALKITTDTQISAKLKLTPYYVDEIAQVLSFKPEYVHINKETTTFGKKIEVEKKDDKHCSSTLATPIGIDENGNLKYEEQCTEWNNKHTDFIEEWKFEPNLKYEEEVKIEQNKVESHYPEAGIDSQPIATGMDLGEKITCVIEECPYCGEWYVISKSIDHYFMYNLVRVIPFRIKAYYLDSAKLLNFKRRCYTIYR